MCLNLNLILDLQGSLKIHSVSTDANNMAVFCGTPSVLNLRLKKLNNSFLIHPSKISTGKGKIIVEFFSALIEFSVCKYLSCKYNYDEFVLR